MVVEKQGQGHQHGKRSVNNEQNDEFGAEHLPPEPRQDAQADAGMHHGKRLEPAEG